LRPSSKILLNLYDGIRGSLQLVVQSKRNRATAQPRNRAIVRQSFCRQRRHLRQGVNFPRQVARPFSQVLHPLRQVRRHLRQVHRHFGQGAHHFWHPHRHLAKVLHPFSNGAHHLRQKLRPIPKVAHPISQKTSRLCLNSAIPAKNDD
jgi:hypothetical protein